MVPVLPVALVAVAATLLNVPMGYWRAGTRKFSWQWFAAIHLAIPLIFLLRQGMGLSIAYIPLMFGCAVAGQLAGGRARSRRYLAGYLDRSGTGRTQRKT